MHRLRIFVGRLLSRFGRRPWETELDDELRFHVEMETHRHRERGFGPADARREALRGLGGLDVIKERYRDQKGLPALDMLAQDVRFGLRLLLRDRAFTAVAVVTLALGIGANTAIFSVVKGVLLDPLPYPEPERIVTVWEDFSARGGPEQEWIEVPNLVEWRQQTDLFSAMTAYGVGPANLTRAGEVTRITRGGVTADFFSTFAVPPALGRDFTPTDDMPGAAAVAILSDGFWQREFGGDAAAVGQSLIINGQPTTIIGVTAPDFELPGTPPADVWAPLQLDTASAQRGNFFLQGLARLEPGVTVARAEERLDALMRRIGEAYPSNRGVTIRLVPLLDQLVAPVRSSLYVLLGVVGFILLIACANIANLLLSRGATRSREMAVRAALGAGRGRMVRQLLTESLLLAIAGAVLGTAVAAVAIPALLSSAPAGAAPRLDNVAIDGQVLLFTMVVSLSAGVLFGLVPATQSFRHDVSGTLKQGGRGTRDAGGGRRLRAGLAISQVAIALCLLIAAGLTIRSFVALLQVDPGFEPAHVTTAGITLTPDVFEDASALRTALDAVIARLAARSIVDDVAAVSVLPMSGGDSDTGFEIEGRPGPYEPGTRPVIWYRRATPSYFRTMGIPVLRGREFTEADHFDAPKVVLISDVAAERFWPGDDAVGKRIRFGEEEWTTIVGITQGTRAVGLGRAPRPELYFPNAQRPGRTMSLVVKSSAPDAAVADALRADVREVMPGVPLSGLTTMAARVAASSAQSRFVMSLTAVFGGLALALAAIGLYGVMTYNVSRRTVEMGLRMALGAGPGRVLSMVLGEGVWLATAGVALGLLAAWWASGWMGSILFDVSARDLVTFVGAPVVLIGIAVVASLIPALRATRVEPVRVLRE